MYLKARLSLILEKQIDGKAFEVGGGGDLLQFCFWQNTDGTPRKVEEMGMCLRS